MSTPITVLIVDDHEVVRNGIHSYLDTQFDFQVVGEADSGESAIEFISYLIPDIVLLDMTMPGMNGVEATGHIKKISPHTQVVILTSILGDRFIFPALKAGAISYLLKNIRMDKSADALRCAARGEATLHPQAAASILQYVRGERTEEETLPTGLSHREMDVLKLIANGLTNNQIARELCISENTVKGHVGKVRSKLQIADRV